MYKKLSIKRIGRYWVVAVAVVVTAAIILGIWISKIGSLESRVVDVGIARESARNISAGNRVLVCGDGQDQLYISSASSCGGLTDITITLPENKHSNAVAELRGYEGLGYAVNGVFRREHRFVLDPDQRSLLDKMISRDFTGIEPLLETEREIPASFTGMQGCVSGKYHAAFRTTGRKDEMFSVFYSSVRESLRAEVAIDPEAAPRICL